MVNFGRMIDGNQTKSKSSSQSSSLNSSFSFVDSFSLSVLLHSFFKYHFQIYNLFKRRSEEYFAPRSINLEMKKAAWHVFVLCAVDVRSTIQIQFVFFSTNCN